MPVAKLTKKFVDAATPKVIDGKVKQVLYLDSGLRAARRCGG